MPYFNLYNFFLKFLPKKFGLKLFGSVVHSSAVIDGKFNVYEPAWLQFNQQSRGANLSIKRNFSLMVDNGAIAQNQKIENDTIITNLKTYIGRDISPATITLSFDFEKDKKSAIRLINLLLKHQIPSTWAIGGYCFQEQEIVNLLKNNPKLFEIGYHSQIHLKYFDATKEEIKKDLAFAQVIREKWGIKLESMVMPYNIVAGLEEILAGGFTNIRAYIGQYKQAKTLDFGNFIFFITSEFLDPKTIKKSICTMPKIVGQNFNYFTHPFNWRSDEDFVLFENFLIGLNILKKDSCIKKMNEI